MTVALKEFQYSQLKAYTKRHGFSSVSELVRAALSLIVIATGQEQDNPDRDEIREMFREYSDSQRQPDGTVPVRHHHKSID